MPKVHAPFYSAKPPRALRPWPIIRAVAILLFLAPFLYEGGQICYARWSRMLGGGSVAVRTPVLNYVGLLTRSARGAVFAQFQRVPWKPQIVIVVGVLSCTACMFLLRGKGSRVE